jgi:hypothetical protein
MIRQKAIIVLVLKHEIDHVFGTIEKDRCVGSALSATIAHHESRSKTCIALPSIVLKTA